MNRLLTVCSILIGTVATMGQNSITEREYWIDQQIAEKQTLEDSPADIDISQLPDGLHSVTVRVKDNNLWSAPVTKFFVKTNAVAAANITERECWIDQLVAEKQTLGDSPAEIDVSQLSDGLHSVTVRVKDNNNLWSAPVTKFFVKPRAETAATIASYGYWIDDDMEQIKTVPTMALTDLVEIDVTALSYSLHTLSWAVCDSKGAWSVILTEEFEVVPPSTTGVHDSESSHAEQQRWYTLDGRLLKCQPSEKGVYVRNNRKVIVK